MPENTENVPFCVERALKKLKDAHTLMEKLERTPWWRFWRRDDRHADAIFDLISAASYMVRQRDIDHKQ